MQVAMQQRVAPHQAASSAQQQRARQHGPSTRALLITSLSCVGPERSGPTRFELKPSRRMVCAIRAAAVRQGIAVPLKHQRCFGHAQLSAC